MNLRSKLFKKPWQHKDPAVRADAVRSEQDAELRDELPRLAQHDADVRVRLAALERINTEPFWLDARLRETEPSILAAADRRIGRSVLNEAREELDEARLEWFAKISDQALVRQVAQRSPSAALRRAALERISSQGFLGDCYISESDDELAAELLDRLDQVSTLERVIDALRSRSKRRARAAADRLEQIRSDQGLGERGQAASERLVSEAERLARGEFRGDASDLIRDLRERWDAVATHPEALARRFDGAMRIAEAARNRPPPEPTAAPETAPAEEPTAPEPDASLAAAADHVRTCIREARKTDPAELLAIWDRAWNDIRDVSPADEALKRDLLPLLRELQAQVQQRKARDSKAASPESSDSDDAPELDLDAGLDRIAETLEAGDIGQAHEQIRSLRSRFDRLPKRRRPAAAGGRLQRMEGRLKEMRNWQHWSNNQLRDELIAQIEALPDAGQHPDAVTAALKKARTEWKRLEGLEILPGDKRRFAAPSGQWRRFQTACKTAFDAAKPYFEKREQLHKDNLETLREFITAGKAAADNPDTDVKELLGFQRKARQAIRRMDDLPPKARGRSAAGLRELMDQLSKRLDAVFDAAESTKRRLVAEARTLAHEKDLKTAIDKAKALQNQWQKAGSGRRKVEQQLWREFREPIDPLFDKLKGEQTERREADRQAQSELGVLCEQAEALARLPDSELEAARGKLTGLIDQWLQMEPRPARFNQRFEKAERSFGQRLEQYQARLQNRERERLWSLASAVQALWARRVAGESSDLTDALPEPGTDDPIAQALAARAKTIAAADADLESLARAAEAGLAAARQVTVEMEFLSGLDTPPDDQPLRMDYQVQRLAQRMGQRERQPDLATELAELQQRWAESLPHPPEQHQALARRFDRARQIIDGMIGGA